MSQDAPRNSIVIAGRYRLEEKLGRGGMGTVWRAYDELLGRAVAVKELHLGDGKEATGALREARTVAQIKHPHVVVVHDVVEHDERPYIVMELVEGGSLADRLTTDGPLDAGETARIGLALLGALSAAHHRGVLHRDVKPANVLMEAGTGRVVLTDFGIARLAGSTTISETGAFVGSPEYTSPERMQGASAGPESDLWSLGALLCAALTGESPFHRDSLGGVLHAVVYDEIRPPAQAGPLIPVIRGLLERDPARRLSVAEAQRPLSAYVTTGSLPSLPLPGRAPGPERPAAAATAPAGYSPTERVTEPAAPGRASKPRPGLRVGLVAALVVVAVSGAVAVTSLLGNDTTGQAQGPVPGAPAASPSPAADPSAARPSAPAAPATATATATVTAVAPAPAPAPVQPASAKPAPAGYRVVTDQQGFALAVPNGFQRSTDAQRVFYVSPDGAIRIGIKVTPATPGGALGAMRVSDTNGPDNNPGYRDNTVVPTTHNGLPAALWEFTWNGFTAAEGPRHTYDLGWDENGRMYDVWVSAPVGRLAQARSHFDAALDSFVPAG
ncbi:serine/threonine protein kinase [Streptomyces sp. NBC_00249]|uniref:serine/threonine-protein kinase n=1 Tax=Streptomyces sp. NBC_00249 TaxID=2975690 RepID=UPI00225928E2|nr:serine/threonine-protein kinase [Streptomyces sp. NBC_00249]MCX5193427.1 serine/threonine protein kinase [Streptomyces sp. NBC_00249]